MKKHIVTLLLISIMLSAFCSGVSASTLQEESVASVNSTLADGIYRIKNVDQARYLTVYDYGYTSNTDVRAKKHINSSNDYSQMWKVTSIGSGYYSIRPLHKPNMGLDVSGTNVAIYGIGIQDSTSSIIISARWLISASSYSGEYFIQNYTYNSKMLVCSLGGDDTFVSAYTGSALQRWTFEPVSPSSKVSIFGDSYLNVGESTNLTAGVFSSATLNQSVSWSSNSSNVSVSSNGRVTATAEGLARIRATSTYDSSCIGLFDIYVGSYGSKSVGLVGIPSNGHDHATCLNTVTGSAYLGGRYGSSNIVVVTSGMTQNEFLTIAAATPVTIVRTHGTQTAILLDESSDGRIYTGVINALPGRPLHDSELLLLMACYVGQGGISANNVVNACFNAGAKYVIGFTGSIDCGTANAWLLTFCAQMNESSNATYSAIATYADENTPNSAWGQLTSRTIRHIDED